MKQSNLIASWALVFLSVWLVSGAAPVRADDKPSTDATLAAALRHRLAKHGIEAGGNVTVTVADSVITLQGTVPTLADRIQAVRDARETEERYKVTDELSVAPTDLTDAQITRHITERIQHFVFYNIFDWVEPKVENGTATLTGWVVEPWHKKQYLRLATGVRGVTKIKDAIKVLPASDYDDQIRREAAREIYNDPLLQGYAYDITKPIHIIVDNARVTLEGWVGSESEKAWATSLVEFHTDAVDVINDLVVKSKQS
jgi:osmotically-inducible protein OsmY